MKTVVKEETSTPRKLQLTKETLHRLAPPPEFGPISESCERPARTCSPECSTHCPV